MIFVHSKRFIVFLTSVAIYVGCLLILRFFPGTNVLFPAILSILVMPTALILTGAKYAPKPFNNFTTWFGVVFIGICILNAIGQDDKNLLISLLSFDVVFSSLVYNDTIRPYIFNEEQFTLIGYFIRVGLGMIYGAVIDLIKYVSISTKKHNVSKSL
ncbi:hypothetical protein [Solibacillus sp. CAU 1738]|uniref:hypothetical protein n=1 Tax=Solibacillus sp. CAU 1738 TaxID=3140363 RepID=UPI003260572E